MSDTFYAVNLGNVFDLDHSDISVAAAAQTSYFLELRVRDGQVTSQQVREFLEKLEHIFATMNDQVIPAGVLIGG